MRMEDDILFLLDMREVNHSFLSADAVKEIADVESLAGSWLRWTLYIMSSYVFQQLLLIDFVEDMTKGADGFAGADQSGKHVYSFDVEVCADTSSMSNSLHNWTSLSNSS